MRKILIILLTALAGIIQSAAEEKLNIDQFFSTKYASNPKVTVIDVAHSNSTDKIVAYRSISVTDDRELADKIAAAVAKDGSRAKSKEVSYKEGVLYYGFYSLGGFREDRSYILYLNRRPTGKEKTTLVFIKADMDENAIKKLINK